MKVKCLFLALALMLFNNAIAQKVAFDKIDPALRREMASRTGNEEVFHITIVMAAEYDQTQMAHKTQFMDKASRRAFVIDELQQFAKSSQYDLMQLLEESAKSGRVKGVNPFWIFNGISCVANREMIEALAERKDVAFIELDELRYMLPEDETTTKVNEAHRELAWHVSQVHADQVWSQGYTGSGVVVAILDTGVNYDHVDLADHMWDGGPDYPYHGYDFINDDNDPVDDHGHGTHCAGITAGDGTSGTQTGIAPDATIMALKVLAGNGYGDNEGIRNAMQFAMEHNTDVVSMSLGASGASGNGVDREIFTNMMNAGIVASIAAGNDGQKYNDYPVPVNIGSPGNCPPPWHNPDQTLIGGHSAVVTVGASERNDRKTTFSSFGPCTWASGDYIGDFSDYPYTEGSATDIGLIKPDIIAPGGDITSCDYQNNNGHVIKKGTSMATPLVSGIMALMLQAEPSLTPAQIDEFLETTALPVDYKVTKNNFTGAGRADALAAIDAISTQATKPTNLSLETRGGNVNLSWTASNAPAGYCIYRDNEQVGTTTSTTYTDVNVGAGKHVYYVRANDNGGHQSVHSNAELCTINAYATVPENLTISWNETDASLCWDASSASDTLNEATLGFVNNMNTSFANSSSGSYLFWGIRILPEDLRPYLGMSINKIRVGCRYNREHTIRIYRGSSFGNTTGEAILSQSFTPTSNTWKYYTIDLDTSYAITDISEDLWIVCSTTKVDGSYPAVVGNYSGHTSSCFYLNSGDDPDNIIWSSVTDEGKHYAACINAYLTRTTTFTPTYNVYLDNNGEADSLEVTSYTDTPALRSGNNTYYVTSKIGDNESYPSNEAKIVVVDNELTDSDDISIDSSLVYLIQSSGILTANITNTNPSRLILEDGAQLIHNSENVMATVKKHITPYTADDNGWNFIANPTISAITPSESNGFLNGNDESNTYDLYYYDEPTSKWKNYENHTFDINPQQGYLYANGETEGTSLVFQGELNPSNESITITGLSHSATNLNGFNLVGNPFACNATVDKDCYVISGNKVILAETQPQIAPCEGIMVKATDRDQTVTFTKVVPSKGADPTNNIDLVVTQDNTLVDRARIRFGNGNGMEKFTLNEPQSMITLGQNGQEFAVVFDNNQNEIPINFKAIQDGTFTISLETDRMDYDYLHLIDNITGADVDLLVTPSYSFDGRSDDYPSRFRLLLKSTDENQVQTDDVLEGDVQILDMTGRIVLSRGD